jgi:eukaryotic-like serine/threonine-protein kinase
MPDWAYGSPAVWNGRVFVTSFDGTFAALNARTGAVLWSHKLPNRSLASPVVIGRYVYVADLGSTPRAKGRVLAYNPGSGHLEWRFNDGKYATPIAAAGRLVVSGATHVYVLRPRK